MSFGTLLTARMWRQWIPASRFRSTYSSSAGLKELLQEQLQHIRGAGTYKEERIITSTQGASISVNDRSNQVLNFCANNYLGLSAHPAVVDAAHEALRSHGFGLSSVRFICGTQNIHKELEAAISRFHGTEDTILYPSCFDANAGLFEAILSKEDAIISDELNHASIIDGVRLCKAQRYRYKHGDLEDLEAKLIDSQEQRFRLIATDGVFSMDGNFAKLDRICELAEKYDAKVFIDECHATGFVGKTGRGTAELFNVEDKVEIINSTLGKALGGATGGYTTGAKEVVAMLRQKARPYLFSNTLAPPVVGASLKVFEMLSSTTELRDKLERNTTLFRTRMQEAGFVLGGDNHPIVPIMLGDARLATEFADAMLARGIYVIGFSYPVVPQGKARIRVQLSAAHSEEQIHQAVDAFIGVGKEMSVI